MARQQLLLLLEDDDDKLNPTTLSRRSLSSQQYNSSIDARDAETEVQRSPQNDTLDDDQPPPLKNKYNVSNDETGLLLSGFGLSPDNGEVELEQNSFEEATVEITTTPSTLTPTSTPTATTTTIPSLPYFYSCADNSNDDRDDSAAEASTSSSSTTVSGTGQGSFSIAKQVVQFDYDLLIASSVGTSAQHQQSIESVYTMVRQFEARLLENVGSELSNHNGGTSLVCREDGASGRERKGEGDGMRLRGGEQRILQSSWSGPGLKLSRLSSLPSDEVLNATCGKVSASSSSSSTNATTTSSCYPVAGYMTIYYITEGNGTDSMQHVQDMNTFIGGALKDVIQRSITNMTDSGSMPMMIDNDANYIVGSDYVGSHRNNGTTNTTVMDTHLSLSPQQLQLGMESSQSYSPSFSTAELIGTVIAGSLVAIAFFMLAIFARRRSRSSVTIDDGQLQEVNGNRSMIIPPIQYVDSSCQDSCGDRDSFENNDCFPSVEVENDEAYYRQHHQHDWLAQTMTVETDTTPRASNVYGQRRYVKSGYSPSRTMNGQSIRECDEEDAESLNVHWQ